MKWLRLILVVIAFLAFNFSFVSFVPSGHHHGTHHSATAACIQLCTLSDRPRPLDKIRSVFQQKRKTLFDSGRAIAGAALTLLAYYRRQIQTIFTLSSWKPPDIVLLSGLHRAAL